MKFSSVSCHSPKRSTLVREKKSGLCSRKWKYGLSACMSTVCVARAATCLINVLHTCATCVISPSQRRVSHVTALHKYNYSLALQSSSISSLLKGRDLITTNWCIKNSQKSDSFSRSKGEFPENRFVRSQCSVGLPLMGLICHYWCLSAVPLWSQPLHLYILYVTCIYEGAL